MRGPLAFCSVCLVIAFGAVDGCPFDDSRALYEDRFVPTPFFTPSTTIRDREYEYGTAVFGGWNWGYSGLPAFY